MVLKKKKSFWNQHQKQGIEIGIASKNENDTSPMGQ